MRVRPSRPDLIVGYPRRGKPLASGGEEVPRTSYWIRRLMKGDVVEVTSAGGLPLDPRPPAPAPAPTSSATSSPTTRPTSTSSSSSSPSKTRKKKARAHRAADDENPEH